MSRDLADMTRRQSYLNGYRYTYTPLVCPITPVYIYYIMLPPFVLMCIPMEGCEAGFNMTKGGSKEIQDVLTWQVVV